MFFFIAFFHQDAVHTRLVLAKLEAVFCFLPQEDRPCWPAVSPVLVVGLPRCESHHGPDRTPRELGWVPVCSTVLEEEGRLPPLNWGQGRGSQRLKSGHLLQLISGRVVDLGFRFGKIT